jgi:mevalonate kinase
VSSSAAVTIATVAAVGKHLNFEQSPIQKCGMAYQVEKDQLKTGAGQMDFYACGLGKLHYLNCITEPPNPLEEYGIPKNVGLILVDTLTPHTTSKYIYQKKERFERGEPLIMAYVDKALAAVEKIRSLMPEFERNIEEIGHNITLCHGYLRNNVLSSTELLDLCVEICLANGAYGGKLTGSGMGGCMFALAKEEDIDKIKKSLIHLPIKVYVTTFSQDGVRMEN